jgi:hypothetical protein
VAAAFDSAPEAAEPAVFVLAVPRKQAAEVQHPPDSIDQTYAIRQALDWLGWDPAQTPAPDRRSTSKRKSIALKIS